VELQFGDRDWVRDRDRDKRCSSCPKWLTLIALPVIIIRASSALSRFTLDSRLLTLLTPHRSYLKCWFSLWPGPEHCKHASTAQEQTLNDISSLIQGRTKTKTKTRAKNWATYLPIAHLPLPLLHVLSLSLSLSLSNINNILKAQNLSICGISTWQGKSASCTFFTIQIRI